jgi:hypothetical protein
MMKMEQDSLNHILPQSQREPNTDPIYPTIDVGFNTRISGDRIKNNEALMQYTLEMEVSDAKYHN